MGRYTRLTSAAAGVATIGLIAPSAVARANSTARVAQVHARARSAQAQASGTTQVSDATNAAVAQLGNLATELYAKDPDTFGGLTYNGDGTYTVFSVGDSSALKQDIASFWAANLTDSMTLPTLAIESTTHTAVSLQALADAVRADEASWAAKGITIGFAGVDDAHNAATVVVTGSNAADAANQFASAYSTDAIRTVLGSVTKDADYLHDTAPWNGGDQIAETEGNGCTTGFGVHSSTTHYILTAGHCNEQVSSPYKWYNAAANGYPCNATGGPVCNSSNYIGQTTTSYDTSTDDTQIIQTSSSDYFWKNGTSRVTLNGSAAVGNGITVCNEGSYSFQSCGTVVATSYGGTSGQFLTEGSTAIEGDSGGPMVYGGGFGIIGYGTIVGSFSSMGNPYTIGESIVRIDSLFGVQVNTNLNP